MSIEEFDTQDELDDAFEANMEWLERKASLEKDIEDAERHVELCEMNCRRLKLPCETQ